MNECKWCDGKGVIYVADGPDDVAPEECACQQKSVLEIMNDAVANTLKHA